MFLFLFVSPPLLALELWVLCQVDSRLMTNSSRILVFLHPKSFGIDYFSSILLGLFD
jgi:hypothetical protein